MIPLAVPNLCGNEARYLQDCIDTTFVSSVGPFVDRFETMVAAAAGCGPRAVATSAGTTALHAALTAVGTAPGELVILPSYTFVASANAIAHCGAQPWLMDVSAESWTLDPELLASTLAIEATLRGGQVYHRVSGRRVAAVAPVHVLGLPVDMDPIIAIAREWGLPVIADGAAALGARYKGHRIGQLGADLTMVSFNGNKTVTAGGGGAVFGENAELLDLVRHLTTTARRGTDYLHDRIGFNYRMTNLQAAVGCAQLENLDVFVASKRHIRRTYDQAFSGRAGITLFPHPCWAESECWFSGIVLDSQWDLSEVRANLRNRGIDARPFWRPMHLQPSFAGVPRTAMPIVDGFWERVLTLPCSTAITDTELETVIAAVTEVLS